LFAPRRAVVPTQRAPPLDLVNQLLHRAEDGRLWVHIVQLTRLCDVIHCHAHAVVVSKWGLARERLLVKGQAEPGTPAGRSRAR